MWVYPLVFLIVKETPYVTSRNHSLKLQTLSSKRVIIAMSGVDVCTLAAAAAKAMQEGRTADAQEALDKLLIEDPTSLLWPAMKARLLLDSGDAAGSLAAAEGVLDRETGWGIPLVAPWNKVLQGGIQQILRNPRR